MGLCPHCDCEGPALPASSWLLSPGSSSLTEQLWHTDTSFSVNKSRSQVILLKLLSLSNNFVQCIVPEANDGAQDKSLASVEHITTLLSTMNHNNIAPFNLLLPPKDFRLVFNHLCLENPGISATTLSSSYDTVRELFFFGVQQVPKH